MSLFLSFGVFILLVSGLQFGLGVWEATVAGYNPVQSLHVYSHATEVAFAYVVTKCVLNFLGALTLFNSGANLTCFEEFSPSSDEDNCQVFFFQILNVAISIWGVVLYFDYNDVIQVNSFRQVIFVELVVFFCWCGIVGIMAFFIVVTVCFEACWKACCMPSTPPVPTMRDVDRPHHKHLNIYQYDFKESQKGRVRQPSLSDMPSETKSEATARAEAMEEAVEQDVSEVPLSDEPPPV